LVNKYSDHVAFPIRMPKDAPAAGDADAAPDAAEGDVEAGAEVDAEGAPQAAAGGTGPTWETINAASALWTRPKAEIGDDEYQSFYKSLGHDFNDAAAWTHNRVEGSQSFTTLLYLPAQPPFDLMMGGRDERKGLKLYIKRVFVMDAAEELLPNYLRFVRGVIDADDLPLNVSRELLQQNRQLDRIKSACVKRILDLIEKLARDEPGKFATFHKAFGNTLKEGVGEDSGNRERIAKLLRFASTRGEGAAQSVSLDDYIARMDQGQDTIWYVTADSHAAAAGSPQLEAFKARGIEVLLMSDRIDEWMLGSLREYDGRSLQHVAKGEFPLDEAGRLEQQGAAIAAAPLLERLKALLAERVQDVRVSARLTESPSCLALSDHDLAPHFARLLREAGQDMPENRPVLEVNPAHALLQRVQSEPDEAVARDLALLLLEQAEIAAGAALPDPAAFVQRMNRALLAR
ncbi:MAG TPA: molecular chaperone HtpG, partial [Luteimonas sp.]|nr:molecular chaperone HtpG [Luteimonas sp.]